MSTATPEGSALRALADQALTAIAELQVVNERAAAEAFGEAFENVNTGACRFAVETLQEALETLALAEDMASRAACLTEGGGHA